jgi:type IV secretion system protein VirD4
MKIRGKEAEAAIRNRDAWNSAWLAGIGPTHPHRAARIRAVFDARSSAATAQHAWKFDGAGGSIGNIVEQGYCTFIVSRSLAALDNREREHLRILDLLISAGNGTDQSMYNVRACLIWGDGKGNVQHGSIGPKLTWQNLPDQSIDQFLSRNLMSIDQSVNWVQQRLIYLDGLAGLNADFREIVDEAKALLSPGGSGAWLASADLPQTAFAKTGDHPIYIGEFTDGADLNYWGEGSMVTIAPPGAGKTQCNVFPNLLGWQGPAVVLDVSGDLYEHTAAWRSANVGPVYRFNPLEPERSHHYNPLTFVRSEPDYIWEDSRLLAEMMIVPSASVDPFWENEARTVLTAAIAQACYSNPPTSRPMHAVLDVLFGGPAWQRMIDGLGMALDVRVMTQHATSLGTMNEKTLGSVLQTARSSLSAWTGERIARSTASSDWNPADLRGPDRPTIYICVRPNEVEAYLSLLRVFIGQHIRVLTGGDVPARDAAPILFLLDELPRLRYMAPVDEALNIGRKYGLRLWMFAQSVGQLKTAYENADGMLGACAVRIYMNPSGADGLADRLSEELGYIDSINDNSRRLLVDAVELSGPAYRDLQLVFGVGSKPAKVRKVYAWQQPELARRMSLQQ